MADEKTPQKRTPKAAPEPKPKDTAEDPVRAVARSTSANAELMATAMGARRPYMDARNVERPKTGRDHTAPGNEAEHPLYSDATVESRRERPAETLAFPALAGYEELETATRTSDRQNVEDTRFRKRYVVLRDAYQPDEDNIHARNQVETLNDALNHGLHPRGEATFDGAEDHPDGASLYLDYSVEVIPAVVDGDAPAAMTPYKVLVDKYDLSTESNAAAEATGARPTQ